MAADRDHPLSRAILEQLQAETAARGQSVASMARALGRNYDTVRRYFVGEKPMPVDLLWASLDVLEIEPEVFLKRARERVVPPAETD